MKRLLLLSALAASMLSCTSLERPDAAEQEDMFELVVEDTVTKGYLSATTPENEIRSWAVAAYSEDGSLRVSRYGTAADQVALKLEKGVRYRLFFLTNCPGVVFPDTVSEAEQMPVGIASVEDFRRDGLPAAADIQNYVHRPGIARVTMRRLVSKLVLTVVNNDISRLELRKAKLCNAAAGVYPFCDRSYDVSLPEFDFTDPAIESLAFRRELILYCFENRRGTVSVSRPEDKVPENMSVEQRSFATYLDVEADAQGRVEGKVHYRMYPGENSVSDLNLNGSSCYRLTLGLSQDALIRGCLEPFWKIDVSGVTAFRPLGFHWLRNGGYFWQYDDFGSDELIVDNPMGPLEYTLIVSPDTDVNSEEERWGPFSPGTGWDCGFGNSFFNFAFRQSSVIVESVSFDPDWWWFIVVRNILDGSIVVAPILQEGQSPFHISAPGNIDPSDLYIGQAVPLEAVGPINDCSRLSWEVSGDVQCISLAAQAGTRSCLVSCIGEGSVTVRANYDGVQSTAYRLTVKSPEMLLPPSLGLCMDGSPETLAPRYCTDSGRLLRMEDFDPALFNLLLRPLELNWYDEGGSYVALSHEPASLPEAGTYPDWKVALKRISEPHEAVGRLSVSNPVGRSVDVVFFVKPPFPDSEDRYLGRIENYLYLPGNRKCTSLNLPRPVTSADAGDPSNVSFTDSSRLLNLNCAVVQGQGLTLRGVELNLDELAFRPDFYGEIAVQASVVNRLSGERYVSPYVYKVDVRMHMGIVMRVFGVGWPNGHGTNWYLTPCWYMPEWAWGHPCQDIPKEVIAWNQRNAVGFGSPTIDYVRYIHFYPFQIGDTAENIYFKHNLYFNDEFEEGQIVFLDVDDYDLAIWWEDDPDKWRYTGSHKSFAGGTLSLVNAPGYERLVVLHDLTKSLEY